MNNVSKRILAFALAVATVIAFTPAIAFTQSASAATRPGKVSWASESKTQTTITLNWKEASKASGYSVYQKKSGKYVKVKTTGSRTYTVKKLKASKTYKFYVKAYRTSHGKKIYGKRSSVKTVTTCNKSAAAQWNIGASASGKAFDGSNGSSSVTATLTTKGVIAMKGSGNTVVFSSKNRAPWTVGTYRTKVKSGTIGSNVKPTNMDYWYYKCSNMTSAPELPTAETTAKRTREVSGNETCVISVAYAWAGTGITEAPQLRNGVENANHAFSGCGQLATGSDIPRTANDITGMYRDCSSLTGAIQVNCGNETSCIGFVSGAATNKDCHLTITVTSGNSPLMETIKTDNSGNLNITVIESQTSTPEPVFSVSVADQSGRERDTVTFTANVSNGTAPYKYEWTKYSDGNRVDFYSVNSPSIEVTVTSEPNQQYKCVVTDIYGQTAEAIGTLKVVKSVQSWNIGAANGTTTYDASAKSGAGNGTSDVVATLYDNGLLEVTGTGNTVVFDSLGANAEAPWTSDTYKSQVKTSTIASGVTPTNMECWYTNCTALTAAPTIPSSVTDMGHTFDGCTALTTAPTIPSSVTDMTGTFNGCTALKAAPTIPGSVTNMNSTFGACTALTTAPTIPSSVTNMSNTFSGCKALTGTMQINANPTSYVACFASASINEGTHLTVNYTSNCTNIDAIIATKSSGSNISRGNLITP